MPDKKLSELSINSTPAKNDLLYGVDVSESDAANKSKGFLYGQIKPFYDVKDFGATRTGTPSANKIAIQAAIDAASITGGIVLVLEPYPCASGLILKSAVSLEGVSPQAFKGGVPYAGAAGGIPLPPPAASAFMITDTTNPFITVQSETGISNIVFIYPNTNIGGTLSQVTASILQYPPTIKSDTTKYCAGVRLSNICLIGGWSGIEIGEGAGCQDIYVDTVYGYPLSGRLLKISNCYDVGRVNRCHFHSNAGFQLSGAPGATIGTQDYVIANGLPAFEFSNCQNLMISQCFVWCAKTGFKLAGGAIWANLVDIGTDCCTVGIELGAGLAQFCIDNFMHWGSAGVNTSLRNAIQITCNTSDYFVKVSNAHASSGFNSAVTSSSDTLCNAFLQVNGTGSPYISLINCSNHGTFSNAILNYCPSAIIRDFGNYWQSTNIQRSKLDIPVDLVVKTIELQDSTVLNAIGSKTADTTLKVKVGNNYYYVLAAQGEPITVGTYAGFGWLYDFDAINIQTSTDVTGGKVTQLKDAISQAVLVQATDANRFTYVVSGLNSQPLLRGTAVSALVGSGLSIAPPYTLLLAMRPTFSGSANVPLMGVNMNPVVFFQADQFTPYEDSSGTSISKSGSYTSDTDYIFVFVYNGSNSKIYFNGTVQTGTMTNQALSGLSIGATQGGGYSNKSLPGDYYKILLASGELTKTQINNTVAQMQTERSSLPWINLT
jgi:hypothetical protein